jgi:hypothetical protein
VISSSYDFQPQMAVLPTEPHPRIIPVHKTPKIGADPWLLVARHFRPRRRMSTLTRTYPLLLLHSD